jgi:hypothetical protein
MDQALLKAEYGCGVGDELLIGAPKNPAHKPLVLVGQGEAENRCYRTDAEAQDA